MAENDIVINIRDNASEVSRNISTLQRQLSSLSGSLSKFNSQSQKLNGLTLDTTKAFERSRGAMDLSYLTKSANQATGSVSKLRKEVFDISKPSLRYALYDVGNSLRNTALALGAAAAIPTGFAIKYERDFANVIRTNFAAGESAGQIAELRSQLEAIAQASPISWSEVTNIATLAGQLGITQELIAGFTENVAKFAATTDLSVEAAATAFGRLGQLIDGVDGQFQELGSAILAVGIDSVATESQIVNVATQIASMANLAKISAADIVGLSGAIASLGIRPELARGTVTRLFSNIGKSVAEAGFNLNEFARLSGRSSTEFAQDWGSNSTAVILDFLKGISDEGQNAERTLRDLGITSVRDIPAILRLAQNYEEVGRLVGISNDAFAEGTEINNQYSIISQTTAEQIKRLSQNLQIFLASVGNLTGPVSFFVGVLNNLLEAMTALSENEVGKYVVGTIQILGLVLAAVVGLGAAAVTSLAGISALKFVLGQLGIESLGAALKVIFSGKAVETLGLKSAQTAKAIRILSISMRALTIASAAIGAIAIAGSFIWEKYRREQERVTNIQNDLLSSQKDLQVALQADLDIYERGGGALKVYAKAGEDLIDVQDVLISSGKDYATGQKEIADSTVDVTDFMGLQAKAANDLADSYLVLGKNTADYLAVQAAQSSTLAEAFSNTSLKNAFSGEFGDFRNFIDLAIGNPEEARQRIAEVRAVLEAELAANQPRRTESGPVGNVEAYNQALDALSQLKAVEESFNGVLEDGNALLGANAQGFSYVADGAGDAAYAMDIAEGKVDALLDKLFGVTNATKRAADATQDYFAYLADGGDAADLTAESLQGMISAIAGNESRTSVERIADLAYVLSIMEQQGLGSSAAALVLRQAIIELDSAAGGGTLNLNNFNIELANIVGNIQPLLALSGATENGLNGIGSAASGAASQVKTLADQFDELLSSIFDPVQAAQDAAQSVMDLGQSYAELGDEAFYASKEVRDAVSSITKSASSPEEAVSNLNMLFNKLSSTVGSSTSPSLQFLRNTIEALAAEFGVAADSIAQATLDLSFFDDGVKNAVKEVRTLVDYAGDLDNVISRAFDIRFATILQTDKLADSWDKLRQNIEDAQSAIEDLNQSQQDLAADRSIKSYFLSVAESYGDMLRAAQLRNEIAAIDKQQAQNAKDIATQEAIAGGSLTGTGEGARQNRGALIDLIAEYQTYITTLAESGASQEELRAATAKARAEFIEQALELGYQESVVLQYAQAFDDVTVAINNVPRNITVSANVNPALQALNELNAKLTDNIKSAVRLNQVLADQKQLRNDLPGKTVVEEVSTVPVIIPYKPGYTPTFGDLLRGYNGPTGADYIKSLGFASGGYTGAGGKYQPAGIVHRGEYVVPSQYVNQSSGLPNANFLAQLQNGMRGYANGGFVGGGAESMMVELSPYDRKLLQDAGNVQLRIDGKVVASATNASNYNQARRGAN